MRRVRTMTKGMKKKQKLSSIVLLIILSLGAVIILVPTCVDAQYSAEISAGSGGISAEAAA